VSLLILTGIAHALLLAQNAQVSGLVRDTSGAVLSDAAVTLTKEETGVRYRSKTGSEGYYSIGAVQPGTYKVRVGRDGFQTAVRIGLKLETDESARIDFTLRLGPIADSISVTAESDYLETDESGVGTVIDRDLIEALPLAGRGLLTLLEVAPGVVITPAASGVEAGQFSAAGRRADANYLTVDGISVDDGIQLSFTASGAAAVEQTLGGAIPAYTALGSMQGLAPVEGVEEFRLETSTPRADAARMPGAHLSITTRSGNNAFHGGYSQYFRNEALDANDWFGNQGGQPRGPFRLNDFGATLGGPLKHNRTFFFMAEEDLRLRHSLAEMQFLPEQSARSIPGFAPPWLNQLPLPNGPEISPGIATYTVNAPRTSGVDSTDARVDHTFGSSTQFFARFSRAPSIDTQDHPGSLGQSILTMTANRITAGLDTAIGLTAANSLRLSYSSVAEAYAIETPGIEMSAYAPPLGLPSSASYAFSVLNLGLAIEDDQARAQQRQSNIVDRVSVSRGRHLIQFGADFRSLAPLLSSSPYFVSSLYSDLPSLAQGNIYVLSVTQRDPVAIHLTNLSLFAQDLWKVTPRFTLNYGLHWEYNPAPSAGDNALLFASVNLQNLTFQYAPQGTKLWQTAPGNFAPRLGFALRLVPGLVLRAAAGAYYDLGFGQALETAVADNTVSFLNVSTSTPTSALPFSFANDPAGLASATKIATGFRTPVSIQWNTSLEKEIAKRSVLAVSYLGSADRRLLRNELLLLPGLGYSNVFTNRGEASYQALQTQLRSRFSKRLQGLASFTWAHSIDNSSRTEDLFSPAVEWAGNVDRGDSSFDVRRAFSAALMYDLPHLRGWSLSTIFRARTGFPLTVNGIDSYFPAGEETRPNLVAGQPIWIGDPNAPGGIELNRAAFAMPPQLVPGTLGRNAIPGFGMSQLDLALQREFTVCDRVKAQLRLETFNTLNHPNFGNPDAFLGDPGFGKPSSMLDQFLGAGGPASGLAPVLQIGGPRSLQLAVRFRF
jgi:hypothetical protein